MYIPTLEGWLYLAAVLDLGSRRIVGWAMANRMTSNLTIAALNVAISQRQPDSGLIHHSGQDSRYTNGTYEALLRDHGIQASMSGADSWYDNAPMESFFGTLRSDLVHHCTYHTRDEAKSDPLFYIEAFDNRRRLHSSLDYLSPASYEHLWQQRDFAYVPVHRCRGTSLCFHVSRFAQLFVGFPLLLRPRGCETPGRAWFISADRCQTQRRRQSDAETVPEPGPCGAVSCYVLCGDRRGRRLVLPDAQIG